MVVVEVAMVVAIAEVATYIGRHKDMEADNSNNNNQSIKGSRLKDKQSPQAAQDLSQHKDNIRAPYHGEKEETKGGREPTSLQNRRDGPTTVGWVVVAKFKVRFFFIRHVLLIPCKEKRNNRLIVLH